jgi:phosphatidate cytidylyltransferase
MGKTPLIKLSPKKTWEGFIGGMVCTLIWAFIGSYYLTAIPALVCPQTKITLEPFVFPHCELDTVYLPQQYSLPVSILGYAHIWISNAQLHSLVIALFSSLIAPFGGFFGSGLKRAFKIKDFGSTIPGHGGITDRCDCQMMMTMFTFVWLHQVVFRFNPTVDGVMNWIDKLSADEQLLIYQNLYTSLFPA